MNFLKKYKRLFYYKIKNKINIDIDKKTEKSTLKDLFKYYGTDKDNHGYTEFYEKHFNPIKEKKINILEIGSYAGSSAASFAKYFPNANIFCIDINISNFKYSSKKIKVFDLDVTNKKKVNNFIKNITRSKNDKFFDIIIDDGSHKLNDMLISLNILFNHVKNDGFYIIEDYKFPNVFDHLNNKDESTIDTLIDNIKSKKKIYSKILDNDTIEKLTNEKVSIFNYQGSSEGAAVVFIKKLN